MKIFSNLRLNLVLSNLTRNNSSNTLIKYTKKNFARNVILPSVLSSKPSPPINSEQMANKSSNSKHTIDKQVGNSYGDKRPKRPEIDFGFADLDKAYKIPKIITKDSGNQISNDRGRDYDDRKDKSARYNDNDMSNNYEKKSDNREFKPRHNDRDADNGNSRFDRNKTSERFESNNKFRGESFERNNDRSNRSEGKYENKYEKNDRYDKKGLDKSERYGGADRGADRFEKPDRYEKKGIDKSERYGVGNNFDKKFERPSSRSDSFDKRGSDRSGSDRNGGGDKFERKPFDKQNKFTEKQDSFMLNRDNRRIPDSQFQKTDKSYIKPKEESFEDELDDDFGFANLNNKKETKKEHEVMSNLFEQRERMTKTVPISHNKSKFEATLTQSMGMEHEIGSKESEPSKEEKGSKMDTKKYEFLYGIHSVEASLNFDFRKPLELFIQISYRENTPSSIQPIIDLANAKSIKIKYLTRERLDKFSGGRPNNGVVLKGEKREYIDVKKFENFEKTYIKKPKGNLLILLDQIIDPQNLGSIIRSAFYLGADNILLNKRNKPPISSAVSKVSSGASECSDLFSIKFVKNFLQEASNNNWKIVSTIIEKSDQVAMVSKEQEKATTDDEEEEILDSQNKAETGDVQAKAAINLSLSRLSLNKNDNVILVLGGESSGVSNLISKIATYNVFIPPKFDIRCTNKHPFNIIDSLNVGVSAGIIISNIKNQIIDFDEIEKVNQTQELNNTIIEESKNDNNEFINNKENTDEINRL